MDANTLLTVTDAAERLGVSTRTIQAWIQEGQFPNAYKLNPSGKNSPYRIPCADIANFQYRQQLARLAQPG